MDLLKRLRKFRSDRALAWVKPATKQYSVIVWRRINPRYQMEGGEFDDVNTLQFVSVDYTRTYIGALLVQLLHGREQWTDGYKQQKVEIIRPGYRRPIFVNCVPPEVSILDFNEHSPPEPTKSYDNGIDVLDDAN